MIQALSSQTGNYAYNVKCDAACYDYSVTVSYDSLSDICASANGVGMTCSLYYNYYAEVYVVAVDDRTTLGLTGTNGVIGNPDGYIYVANDPDAGQEESNRYLWNIMYANQSIFRLLDVIERDVLSGSIATSLTKIETALGTGVGSLGYNVQRTLNFLTGPINDYLSSIDSALTDEEDSPLLTRLDSIIAALTDAQNSPLLSRIQQQINLSNNYYQDLAVLLVQLRAALENLTINADSLENLTIDAYDDSMLLG